MRFDIYAASDGRPLVGSDGIARASERYPNDTRHAATQRRAFIRGFAEGRAEATGAPPVGGLPDVDTLRDDLWTMAYNDRTEEFDRLFDTLVAALASPSTGAAPALDVEQARAERDALADDEHVCFLQLEAVLNVTNLIDAIKYAAASTSLSLDVTPYADLADAMKHRLEHHAERAAALSADPSGAAPQDEP